MWQTLVSLALTLAAAGGDVVEKRYPDGTVRLRTEVRTPERGEPIPHGKQTRFFPSGKPAKEFTYVDGVLHGPWTQWLPGGAKMAEGKYTHGLKDGVETYFLSNGEKS